MASTTTPPTFPDAPPIEVPNPSGADPSTVSKDLNDGSGAEPPGSAKYLRRTAKLLNIDGVNENHWTTDFHCFAIGNGKVSVICSNIGTASYWRRDGDEPELGDLDASAPSSSSSAHVQPESANASTWVSPSAPHDDPVTGKPWGGFDMRVVLPEVAENVTHYGPGFTTAPGFTLSLREDRDPVTVRILREANAPKKSSYIGWCFTFVLPGNTRHELGMISTPLLPTGKNAVEQARKKTVFLDLTSL